MARVIDDLVGQVAALKAKEGGDIILSCGPRTLVPVAVARLPAPHDRVLAAIGRMKLSVGSIELVRWAGATLANAVLATGTSVVLLYVMRTNFAWAIGAGIHAWLAHCADASDRRKATC